MESNRRFRRVPVESPVLVRRNKADLGAFSEAKCLGRGGCMFLHRERLEPGELLTVTISVKGGFIQATSRVVYANPTEGGFEIGMEFVEISDLDLAAIDELLEEA